MKLPTAQAPAPLRLLAVLLSVFLLLAGPAAVAQDAAAPAGGAVSAETTQDLQTLVETLKDEGRRQDLVTQLEAMIAATGKAEAEPPAALSVGAELLRDVSDAMGEASAQLVRLGEMADNLPTLGAWMLEEVGDAETRAAAVTGLGQAAAVVAVALLAFWVVRRVLRRPRKRLQSRDAIPRWYERIVLSLGVLLLELAPVGALLAAGYGVMPVLDMDDGARVTALLVLTGIAVVNLVLIVARVILAPRAPALRWAFLGHEMARHLYTWVRRLALVGVIGFLAAEAASAYGLPEGGYMLLTRLVGLVLAVMMIVLILQNKTRTAAWIRNRHVVVTQEDVARDATGTTDTQAGNAAAATTAAPPPPEDEAATTEPAEPEETEPPASGVLARRRRKWRGRNGRHRGTAVGRVLRDRFADVWYILAILYVLAAYLVWAVEVEGGFFYLVRGTVLTVVIVAVSLGLVNLLAGGVARLFQVDEATRGRFPGIEKRARVYLPTVQTGVRAIVFLIATGAILQAWGVDVLAALRSDSGAAFLGSLVTILLILLLSFGGWELASARIERYLSATDSEGNVIERSARAKTLLPLLRNILLVAMVVVVGMVILSELGVNIAPLLAGAGVIGLAVGFGAQKLVQDIITGAFILFENTISVGDVVSVGGHAGLVEGMSVRTIRLRDLSGTVHTIPFSAVDKISNLTKDFSYYVLDVGVAYREDTDAVVKVCEEIVEEMRQDPVYGKEILEPLEVLGVDRFADSAVIVKSRIKTKPIQQWFVGREFNRRMKKRFDDLGIEIPFPHRTLYFGEDKAGKAPQARVLVEHFENRPPPGGNDLGGPTPPAPLPPNPSDTPDPEVV